ncbi:phosphoribosylglycinamide formyltransferase, formyltetrahydrofolate-dependent [Rubidibacter lacunae KORDI 51-2]|uniref:Phosphoribosylglycinamide formyltransferase n=1 Tax=Rubidibacter lacunae KORDI 51-2 TaxID=582515 RepID=U5DKZ4_9CHRO|nr:phosphoribosylglycinamide formyltransferase [Rubidibacter lacunae]ERN41234.1 phosphoribosylglycinamide formyltransferase, formyltetrahydrofolate-dependent [Rubidibacter lacunae KORDI 51-2]
MSSDSPISPTVTTPPLDPPVRLGIMASGTGSNFVALCDAVSDRTLSAEIAVLIYNNPGALVAERAKERNVPAVLLDHRQYKPREELDRAIVAELQRRNVEWVVMAGWMRIVTPLLIEAFRDRALNIHPSLLPSFKGAHAVENALDAGVKITGCTVHYVREQVDSGPIVMQAAVPVLPDDTRDTLHARIQAQEYRILPQAIALAVHRSRSGS